ncbi:MAG: hypothetical protein AB1657_05425 [Candidatus Micrarchaeota archaeon]
MGEKTQKILAALVLLIGLATIFLSAIYASWGTMVSGLILAMLGLVYDKISRIELGKK